MRRRQQPRSARRKKGFGARIGREAGEPAGHGAGGRSALPAEGGDADLSAIEIERREGYDELRHGRRRQRWKSFCRRMVWGELSGGSGQLFFFKLVLTLPAERTFTCPGSDCSIALASIQRLVIPKQRKHVPLRGEKAGIIAALLPHTCSAAAPSVGE